jgi:hypothetical protein
MRLSLFLRNLLVGEVSERAALAELTSAQRKQLHALGLLRGGKASRNPARVGNQGLGSVLASDPDAGGQTPTNLGQAVDGSDGLSFAQALNIPPVLAFIQSGEAVAQGVREVEVRAPFEAVRTETNTVILEPQLLPNVAAIDAPATDGEEKLNALLDALKAAGYMEPDES